ncbi:TRAP transporter small permease [Cohaesibacter haloalkalitolerans]|uniref:TRAP transporter small permease n=1 Tax=Cohaesibacter haloalkalitolerans TaxID=1162980 RepID=UPI000E64F6CE|nr:TRAP transporter small permease [Cohaesibacter haloalkalitolerans]
MHAIKRWADRILATTCTILCGLLVIAVTWQVIGRFFFNSSGAVSEELAKIMFVWFVLLGAALLFGEKGHMAIEFGLDIMPPRTQTIFQIIISILILGFIASILLIGGIDAVQRTMRQTNAAIPYIKTGQIYLALPLCGGFSVFYCLYNIWNDFRTLVGMNQDQPSKMEG